MNNFRKLLIKFKNINDLQKWYNLEFKNLKKLNDRNIRLNYRKSNINQLVLYGYDKKEKYRSNIINNNELNSIFKKIDKMPMRELDNRYRKRLDSYTICGFDDKYPTEHCFTDGTHHTCCMLGSKAREYANKSGNPIGKVSEESFRKFFNKKPLKNDMTPWCTCIGSKVCSYYADRFNDGTHIKFINNKDKKILAYNFESKCENRLSKEFNYNIHSTPGIFNNKTYEDISCDYKIYKY